jgi:hypothetical protein
MKTSIKIVFLAVMVLLPAALFSQTKAIGHMCVTIVSPASISSINDMSLGNVSLSSNADLKKASERNAAKIEMVDEGNVSLASFKVSGTGATFNISLPEEPVITNNDNNDMKVSGFRAIRNAELRNSNTENITVGATVQLNKNVAHGLYTSATPMRVTVNYN